MNTAPDSLCHVVTALIASPPSVAFGYLADARHVGSWALGAWDAAPSRTSGVYVGHSLYDGEATYFRADADPARLVVDYLVGGDANNLVMRISARVIAGGGHGYGDSSCLVSLSAWRPAGMPDDRWRRLQAFHEVEIMLLEQRIAALG